VKYASDGLAFRRVRGLGSLMQTDRVHALAHRGWDRRPVERLQSPDPLSGASIPVASR
jgi:hypothetical protein